MVLFYLFSIQPKQHSIIEPIKVKQDEIRSPNGSNQIPCIRLYRCFAVGDVQISNKGQLLWGTQQEQSQPVIHRNLIRRAKVRNSSEIKRQASRGFIEKICFDKPKQSQKNPFKYTFMLKYATLSVAKNPVPKSRK